MRELPLTNIEKKFVLKAVSECKRLDGRKLEDFRPFDIHFGREWGSCFVTLGETKVLATVSCEIQEPKPTRPNEGLLFINVELSPMAAPHFEVGARSELGVHLNRMLEKCLKESKAVDLEALCIVADDKVWVLRVDVHIINHDGNMLDCASFAALAALAHFRRPDVTTDGEKIEIHDLSERDPIPNTLHHFPVCVSFALLSESHTLLSDPTALEEKVSEASLVYGINAYKELCALHLGGTAVLAPQEISRSAGKAAIRARIVVQVLKDALAKDLKDRLEEKPVGFVSCIATNKITSLFRDRLKIQLGKFRLSGPLAIDFGDHRIYHEEREDERREEDIQVSEPEPELVDLGNNSAELISSKPPPKKRKFKAKPFEKDVNYGEGGPSKWVIDVKEAPTITLDSNSSDDEIMVVPAPPTTKVVENIELSGDSDEDITHVMDSVTLEAAGNVQTSKKESGRSFPRQKKSKKKKKSK